MNVSVIIPTYNRKDMVLRAIKSVQSQSLKAFEIIVVDDGSTDGTKEHFPMDGITYYRIDHCGYPGKVRNFGVDRSKGDYIAFLDSDDIWELDKLKKQIDYFKANPGCRLLHTKEIWSRNGRIISQKKRKHKRFGNIFADSLHGCIIGPSTVCMDRALFIEFKGFNETIEVGEDYDLWLRITNSCTIDYIDDELIIKNAGHGDQLSFKYNFIEPFRIAALENLIETYKFSPGNRALAIESLIKKFDLVINGCTKNNNISEAQIYNTRKDEFLKSI